MTKLASIFCATAAFVLISNVAGAEPATNSATTIASATTSPATAPSAAGHWEGAIALPAVPMVVRVDLAERGDSWSGTIDIPQQHATKLTLDPVMVAGSQVRFTIHAVPGDPTFDGQLVDGKLTGTFRQGGLTIPFALSRAPYSAPATTRAAELADNASYHSEEVGYDNGAVHLAGTLTLPTVNHPVPAVVLITGSGPQNRDEEILGHKPFRVLADALGRAGIAVLRADDRGVGQSTGGSVDDATTDELAGDTAAAIAFLKTRPEIAQDHIGLIGHSEGADIAALLASRSKDVAFIVMMAGAGVPGDQIIERQSALLARAAGESPATVEHQAADMQQVLHDVEHDGDPSVLRQRVREMIVEQMNGLNPSTQPSDAAVDVQVDPAMQRMRTRWFRYFLTMDPRAFLSKVTVPVLVLNGDKDLQVDPDQNLPAIISAFGDAGNHDVTVLRMAGLNHLFQAAVTGSVDEYAKLSEDINPAAVAEIRDWIVSQAVTPQVNPQVNPQVTPQVTPPATLPANPAAK